MKKIILSMLALSTIALSSCGDEKANEEITTENVETSIGGTYNLAEGSVITWNARHYKDSLFPHTGTVAINAGTIVVENKNVVGGEFDIDMSSITEPGADTTQSWTLVGHLKMADFFDTENNASAKFSVAGVTEGVLSGSLEIRGMSKDISFPVELNVTEDEVTATADFELDLLQFELPMLVKGDSLPEVEKMESPYPKINFQLNISANKAAH